ncbi:MAG: hypothetical protein C0190_00475 [Thermodesulfobacterium geofontis]|uniref:SprT-like domain-containing protein n=1 Tax=Thermodesulfobacterium geofontis TaxID=1295609 RepID=A0A2N7PQL5_9BACT|nr:MAG: hypothetical protein C0190_00475 [Thermodesulfobacterium geofontis]PMP98151.1 MAG: hypothetical protein C0169_00335 [Thermodesulfobacterium geofontis]
MARILSKGTEINSFLRKSCYFCDLENILYLCELNLIEKFKLSEREINRLIYNVYVLKSSKIFKNEFATILKGELLHDLPSRRKDFYFICLNKSKIFNRKNPFLKELLFYILTHELIHLVRFIRYESNFYLKYKWEEEKIVHQLTKIALKDFTFLPYMRKVFRYFDRIYS